MRASPTFRLADAMAKTPDAALELMRRVWAPARAQALREAEALQDMIAAEGGNFQLQPWDWRYYAEKRRKALYDVDQSELKPYLPLEAMIAAAFDVAHRLFGVPSSRATTCRLANSTRAPGRRSVPTARRSRCSSATISRGTRNTAAPG